MTVGSHAVPSIGARKWLAYPAYKDSGIAWLGKIPVHWEVKHVKNVAELNQEVLPETTPSDHEMLYMDIGGVDLTGRIYGLQPIDFGNAPSRARRIARRGDTVISTVRTYLRAIAFMDAPPENLVVSTGFAVLRPRPGLVPKYLFYLARSQQFVETVMANSVGVGYPAINPATLNCLPVWLPSPLEQEAIATFLDRETAKIDALIAKRGELIALLEEKRAALISHAVTMGLDPEVPMKDSGIPAIGQVPNHWEVRRNKWVFGEVDERSTSGSEELLTVSHITGVTPRSEKEVYMFLAESNEGYKVCRPNDLAINTMWAYMGAVGIVPRHGIVSPSYNVYRLRKEIEYLPQYLDYLYRTPPYISEINRHSKGIWKSRLRLYPDSFFEMRTLTPPLPEQHQIVEYLSRVLASIETLRSRLAESVSRLQECRTSLISAAVTGKIDVRGDMR